MENAKNTFARARTIRKRVFSDATVKGKRTRKISLFYLRLENSKAFLPPPSRANVDWIDIEKKNEKRAAPIVSKRLEMIFIIGPRVGYSDE